MTSPIRIVIAEDHSLVRTGLRLLIESQPDMKVIGEAENGVRALNLVMQLHPEVAVVDLSMPVKSGLEFMSEVRHFSNPPRILVLTANKDASYLQRVLALGGTGYVHKQSAAENLILAIRTVARGHRFLPAGVSGASRNVTSTLLDKSQSHPSSPLSDREKAVLQLIAQGNTTKEVAATLDLSIKTVETYKSRAMLKLNLNGRAELVRYALQHQWLSDVDGS